MGLPVRHGALLGSLGVLVFAALQADRAQAVPPQDARKIEFGKDVRPALEKFCIGCHSGKEPPGGLDLSKARSDADLQKADKDWERVHRAIESGHMPPATASQPSNEQRAQLAAAIQSILSGNCTLQDPGRVTIRRLNRFEYANTVRDLLGIEFRATDDFPSDDVGYGFDNIGDVLTISPLLLEKYLDSAERIASMAIVLPGSKTVRYEADKTSQSAGTTLNLEGDRSFFTNATSTVDHVFPSAGAYRIKVLAFGQQAGPEPCRMQISLDGKVVQTVNVAAISAKPEEYEVPIDAQAGKHTLGLTFPNDFYAPNNPDPAKRDRNLVVRHIEVIGPIGGGGALPDVTRRIIPSLPVQGKELAAARQYLGAFASRAYRRPARTEEVDALVRVFKVPFENKETFARSMQVAVSAALVSPQFLFRVELDPKAKDPNSNRLLDSYEIASRLSYFLWSSMPDEELLRLASAGKLNEPKAIEAQVDRMLKDPKAEALAKSFGEQWLQLRKLTYLRPDPGRFPNFSRSLQDLMLRQTYMFFEDVVQNDRSIVEFLDSKFTFLNNQLAAYYDIPGVEGNQMRRVEIDKPERGGLLGQGTILLLTSNPTRTSPTKRGRWILEQILGTPPPPPPPGADVLKPKKAGAAALTLRAQMEEHRSNPDCASCHSRMDPLGFSLENFDAVGQWRYKDEGGANVDASGKLPDGTTFSGPVELKSLLLSKKDMFARSLAEKLVIFGLGRGVTLRDDCALDEIAKRCRLENYRFSAMIKAIAVSDPFRKRRAE